MTHLKSLLKYIYSGNIDKIIEQCNVTDLNSMKLSSCDKANLLYQCVIHKQLNILKWFISEKQIDILICFHRVKNSMVSDRCYSVRTPFKAACQYNRQHVVKYIFETIDTDIVQHNMDRIFQGLAYALMKKNVKLVLYVIDILRNMENNVVCNTDADNCDDTKTSVTYIIPQKYCKHLTISALEQFLIIIADSNSVDVLKFVFNFFKANQFKIKINSSFQTMFFKNIMHYMIFESKKVDNMQCICYIIDCKLFSVKSIILSLVKYNLAMFKQLLADNYISIKDIYKYSNDIFDVIGTKNFCAYKWFIDKLHCNPPDKYYLTHPRCNTNNKYIRMQRTNCVMRMLYELV